MRNLDGWVIAPELYNWIRENIKDGSTILELGSGTGTIELCKHYTVYSVEHDKKWIGNLNRIIFTLQLYIILKTM